MGIQSTQSATQTRDLDKDVVELIQIMGQSLNTALLYGMNHKVTRSSLEISYAVVSQFLEFHGPIHFSLSDGAFLINGASTTDIPQAVNFAARLTGLNLLSFTIEAGFSQDECVALFTLLLTNPATLAPGINPSEIMGTAGLLHVQAKSFSYRRVSEDDPSSEEDSAPPPDLDNLSPKNIRQLTTDTGTLSDLIFKTVESHVGAATHAGEESMTDLVVGCIQKVLTQIVKDPISKTQKGRKHIKQSLLMLEKSLLERLRTLAGDQAAQATEAMMDEIIEDLDLEAITSKYMKTRRAAEKTSVKLTHLIENAADDPDQMKELRDRLLDQGLSPEGWQQLTRHQEHATDRKSDAPGEAINEIKVLTLLLTSLGETIHHAPSPVASTEVQQLISDAGQHLASLAIKTEKKIDTLRTLLTDETKASPPSRRELLEILAEIAQEIFQPLTIITGTAAMIRSLRTGPLTETQGELLGMIAESGDRMTLLVNHLMYLAGTPEALHPDRAILDAAYHPSPRLDTGGACS